MEQFHFAHASGDSWSHLVKRCSAGLGSRGLCGNLGLIYVTEPLAGELSSIVAYLREATGIPHWVGAAAPGVCASGVEYFDEPAMVVMACAFDDRQFEVLPSVDLNVATTLAGMSGWIERTQPCFGIVHGDPRDGEVGAIVRALAEASDCFLVGGLTAALSDAQFADTIIDGGVSGVLFAQDVEVATGLTQGCTPIGESHTVTRMAGHSVAELDERSALAVFKEDVGEVLARDLSRTTDYIHGAVPVPESEMGDYLVRNLIDIDVTGGKLAIGEMLKIGDQIMFVRRDTQNAKSDMARMLKELKRRVGGAVRGGVYYSCSGRGPYQFGPGNVEMTMIADVFGDIPIIGFFGHSEIFQNRVYCYTGVLTLFV
ncbi:MAG: FIST signal transduction protein [Alphaproteobacteria bacterium]